MLPCFTVKLAGVMERGSIALLKLAVILVLTATPVPPSAGFVALTTGAAVSVVVPVVKLHERSAAKAAPAADFAPVVIVAVKRLLGARLLEGANVAAVPSALEAMVPETGVVPCFSVKVAAPSGSIAMSKVADSFALRGTPVATSEGKVELSVGDCEEESFPPQARTASASRAIPRRFDRLRWADG